MRKIVSFLYISFFAAALCACSNDDDCAGGKSADTYDVSAGHILINQFYGGVDNKGAASNCFAELYNPMSQPQVLDGWSLWYLGAASDTLNKMGWKRLLLKGSIPAQSSFLIRGNVYACDKKAYNYQVKNPDQEWDISFNTKGMALLLKSDTASFDQNATIFDNTLRKPSISHYVDMLAVHGNDATANEYISAFEGNTTYSQSSKRAIRRQYFQDTDLNEVDTENGDCVTIDYSAKDSAYIAWAHPRNTSEGAWKSSDMPAYKETTSLYADSVNVITTSITTNPYQSRSFTWQMPLGVTQGSVTLSTSATLSSPTLITGVRSVNSMNTASIFRASTTNLAAGTTYYYQITSGDARSPVYSFTTGSEGDSFTFLHTSDTQSATLAGYITYARALQQVVDVYHPQFVIQTGDEVETNYFEDEWRWFVNKASSVMAQVPYFPTVGNHEQTVLYPATAFREHFSIPNNTCTASSVTPGTVYSFNWGKVHFVVLNTQCKDGLTAQAEWLRSDLSGYKNGHIVVCMHRGVYDLTGQPVDVTSVFASIFAEYGVSLVLYGHDHCYMRSVQDDETKTIHLQTGSSGIKQQLSTGVTRPSYTDILATPQLPTISVITVTSTEIKVHTVTVDATKGIVPLDGNSSVQKANASMSVDFSISLK